MGLDGIFAASIAGGILMIVIMLAFTVAACAFSVWAIYTLIWRAVRRGLQEFYGKSPVQAHSQEPTATFPAPRVPYSRYTPNG